MVHVLVVVPIMVARNFRVEIIKMIVLVRVEKGTRNRVVNEKVIEANCMTAVKIKNVEIHEETVSENN